MVITTAFLTNLRKKIFQNEIDQLLQLRQTAVYGQEEDYFDDPNCIAWTCLGDDEHPTALAILISNAKRYFKNAYLLVEKWANHILQTP